MSLDDQNVGFFPDGGDETLEFENLGEVAQYRAILPSNMHGLNVISHSFEKLIAYCNAHQVPILFEEEIKEPKENIPLIKVRPVANPGTQESKNFLANVKEILYLRYVEKRKPKEIGKLYCIGPEKINHLVRQFVEKAEER